MRRLLTPFLAAALLCAGAPAIAQQVPQGTDDAGGNHSFRIKPDGTQITAAIPPQEAWRLVAANVPTAAVQVFGGNYLVSQVCTAYGTLSVQTLGPDGSTYLTVLSKTSADTTTSTAITFASYATVRMTVTGTTGCNATLSRVPS